MNKIFYKIIRNYTRLIVHLIVGIICWMIYIFSFSFVHYKQVTVCKVKRIRKLTKFKIWCVKTHPNLMKYLGYYNYLHKLELRYGM